MYAVDQSPQPAPDLWQALADPTRRALIDRLADGPRTTSQLCAGMPMTRFGVMKHLAILERAGLVIARRQGRLRLNHLNAAPLRALQARWLSPRALGHAEAAERLADHFKEDVMEQGNGNNGAGIVDVALDWPVEASVQRLWQALVDEPELWWPAAHRAVGEGATMRLDARLGGTLSEEGPDGGILWYQVIAIEPLRSIDLAGHLAARYGGPASSLLNLAIAPGEREGTSILKLTDSVFGRIGPELRASLTSGWQAIIGGGLVAHLAEGGGQ